MLEGLHHQRAKWELIAPSGGNIVLNCLSEFVTLIFDKPETVNCKRWDRLAVYGCLFTFFATNA